MSVALIFANHHSLLWVRKAMCQHHPHPALAGVTRFVVYLRVSTLRQGASGLGIEAQREAVARHVASTGGRILAEVVETESGKQSTRQGEMLPPN
jgi:Resolvase, N terminal domain